MVCHMCISTMQWRLRRATPRKTSQPCKTPAEMVLSTLQCSETMCQLCRPFAEQCRGRHMVCHMCISTVQWRLRRATPRKTSQPCKTPAEMVLSTLQCSETMCQLCRPFAEQCRGRHMVCHMCISTVQWRLRRATPRKTSQPCKTPAEMVLSTLQCSETMCQLCRPFAEQCRGRHMVCHMCISTVQWRLRRAPPPKTSQPCKVLGAMVL